MLTNKSKMDCIAIIETVICLSQSYTVLLPICISCTKYKKISEKFSKLSPTHFIVKHICTRSKRMALNKAVLQTPLCITIQCFFF